MHVLYLSYQARYVLCKFTFFNTMFLLLDIVSTQTELQIILWIVRHWCWSLIILQLHLEFFGA